MGVRRVGAGAGGARGGGAAPAASRPGPGAVGRSLGPWSRPIARPLFDGDESLTGPCSGPRPGGVSGFTCVDWRQGRGGAEEPTVDSGGRRRRRRGGGDSSLPPSPSSPGGGGVAWPASCTVGAPSPPTPPARGAPPGPSRPPPPTCVSSAGAPRGALYLIIYVAGSGSRGSAVRRTSFKQVERSGIGLGPFPPPRYPGGE